MMLRRLCHVAAVSAVLLAAANAQYAPQAGAGVGGVAAAPAAAAWPQQGAAAAPAAGGAFGAAPAQAGGLPAAGAAPVAPAAAGGAAAWAAAVPQAAAAPVNAPGAAELSAEQFVAADVNRDGCVDAREFSAWAAAGGAAVLAAADTSKDAKLQQHLDKLKKPAMTFWAAFFNSIAMIIVTELGDKTFFIAAIMAMQHDRMPVFGGAIGALAVMTVLSAAIGFALPNLLPRKYTHYAASILFAYFGFKLLKEGAALQGGHVSDELEEVEQELGASEGADAEAGDGSKPRGGGKKDLNTPISILSQAFMLTFLAEWGDRSQIATIALATAKDPVGVTLGGILGHALCTGLAVVGGKLLATRISEKAVLLAGGALFCVFAVHSVWAGP